MKYYDHCNLLLKRVNYGDYIMNFFLVVFDMIPAGPNCVKIQNVKSGLYIAIDQNGDIMTKVWIIYISFYIYTCMPCYFLTFASCQVLSRHGS